MSDDDSIADFAKYAQVEEATNKDILLLIPGKTDVVVKRYRCKYHLFT